MIPQGFEPMLVDSRDVPLCKCGSHYTTQTLAGEWYCRFCEVDRANANRERTLRTMAAAIEIRRRPYCRRQQNGTETNGANDGT